MGLRRRRGAFHTAAVDRTVARAIAASLYSFYYRRRVLRPQPGPSGNTAGEREGDAPGERGEPWCHVLAVSGLLTAAPDRCPPASCRGEGSGLPPRRTNAGPVRRGATDRTTRPGMSSRDGELKGASNELVADGGIEPQTSPSEQPEPAAREDRVDLRRRRTQGRLRGARGGFFPAVSPLTWRTSALRIASQS